MSDEKGPGFLAPEDRPRYWDKRVAAAYLRMMGHTQAEAGASVGRHEDTIGSWERDDSWPYARAEAREKWMADVDDASNRAILKSVKLGNVDTAKWFKEHTDTKFRKKHEHSGPDGRAFAPTVVILPPKGEA